MIGFWQLTVLLTSQSGSFTVWNMYGTSISLFVASLCMHIVPTDNINFSPRRIDATICWLTDGYFMFYLCYEKYFWLLVTLIARHAFYSLQDQTNIKKDSFVPAGFEPHLFARPGLTAFPAELWNESANVTNFSMRLLPIFVFVNIFCRAVTHIES